MHGIPFHDGHIACDEMTVNNAWVPLGFGAAGSCLPECATLSRVHRFVCALTASYRAQSHQKRKALQHREEIHRNAHAELCDYGIKLAVVPLAPH